jgi:hypothetical protein
MQKCGWYDTHGQGKLWLNKVHVNDAVYDDKGKDKKRCVLEENQINL